MAAADQPTQSVALLDVAVLRFDPENPRLPSSVNGTDDAQVLNWMLVEESLTELMGSVGAQDYFRGEPVLVVPQKKHGRGQPSYVVVEGNRRLAAVRLLLNPDLAPSRQQSVSKLAKEAKYRPTQLPTIAFSSRDQILDYLGYRHVTGVKEWDPLAKARYLNQLVKREQKRGKTLDSQQLARRIGSRADYVDRLLEGLEVYDHLVERRFYDLEGVSEDTVSFSVLTTALSYEKIEDYLGLADAEQGKLSKSVKDDSLRDVVDWVFKKQPDGKPVVAESRQLGQLAEVVAFPEARQALRDGTSLADAALLTDEPLLSFRKAVRQASAKLALARTLTHRINAPSEADVTMLTELGSLARDLAVVIKSKVDSGDEVT